MKSLLELVREAYKDATEGGYDMSDMTDYDVAADMLAYDAFIEGIEPSIEDVEEAVHTVRDELRGQK